MLEKDPIHPFTRDVEQRSGFSDFVPFINSQGLNTEQSTLFKKMLEDFYTKSMTYRVRGVLEPIGKMWRPGFCQRTIFAPGLAPCFVPHTLSVCEEPRWHRWLEIDIDSDSALIIDPSGLPPAETTGDKSLWSPYFGKKDVAPSPLHKKIYGNGVRLSLEEIEQIRSSFYGYEAREYDRYGARPIRAFDPRTGLPLFFPGGSTRELPSTEGFRLWQTRDPLSQYLRYGTSQRINPAQSLNGEFINIFDEIREQSDEHSYSFVRSNLRGGIKAPLYVQSEPIIGDEESCSSLVVPPADFTIVFAVHNHSGSKDTPFKYFSRDDLENFFRRWQYRMGTAVVSRTGTLIATKQESNFYHDLPGLTSRLFYKMSEGKSCVSEEDMRVYNLEMVRQARMQLFWLPKGSKRLQEITT